MAARVLLAIAAAAAIAVSAAGCSQATSTPTTTPDATACRAAITQQQAAIADEFWAANSDFGRTAFRYESLAEIVADSDLIIRGRVVGTRSHGPLPIVDPGDEINERPRTFGLVSVDEVLKGAPMILDPGGVLVLRVGPTELHPADLPAGEVVIFLKNYEELRREFGRGLFNDANDRFYYVRPNGYQAVLRNLDCVVRVVHGPDEVDGALLPFPGPLDGQPIEALLDNIRRLATT